MINQSTTDKLIEMRLTAMADAFRIQMDDSSIKDIPFEDRFGMLVDVEYTSRKNNRLKRIIRNAELEQPDACIAGIDYRSGRKLNKELINRLATCEYIAEYRNIFITGATGSGKTYMACAFGMEACKQYYTVKYVRLPDLLLDLEAARNDGTFTKVLSKYTKPLLLIIDEWLLLKLNESESKNLFELIHKRRKKSSTIFCSQFREEGWYDRLGGDEYRKQMQLMDKKESLTASIQKDAVANGRRAKAGDLITDESYRSSRYGSVGRDGKWRFSESGASLYSGTNVGGNKQIQDLNRQIEESNKHTNKLAAEISKLENTTSRTSYNRTRPQT